MSYSGIYELTEFQFANLYRSANGNSICFAVLESCDKDDDETKETFNRQLRETRELIDLGLLTDVSDKFKEQIQVSKINSNRGYIVVSLTDHAVTLFTKGASHEC